MKKLTALILTAILTCSALFAETQTYSFLPAQIKNIDVNFAAGNVTVKTDFTDHINITITKEVDASAPTVKLEKDTLTIKTKLLSSFKKEQDIEICVPTGLKLNDIKFVCVSANSYVEEIEANNVSINSTSGLIKIKNSKIYGTAKLAGASGKITVKDSEISTLTSSAVSAEISYDGTKTGLAQMETINGKLNLTNAVTDVFELQTMGGAIEIQLNEIMTKNSSVKSSSGNINLVVPKNAPYNAVVTTLNGSFIDNNTFVTAAQCEELLSTYQNGTVEIKMNTKSGKITVGSN